MIHLYTWKTPNGKKPPILLEELGIPYQLHPVDISKNEQFQENFLKISPNNKIPAIVDDETGTTVFESGAILMYLAEKHGKFLAKSGADRAKALEWLFWQVSGFGPMLGQLAFFAVRSEEKIPLPIKRFTEEADRLLTVLDKRLGEGAYVTGENYSIADIATYPWAEAATTFLKEPLQSSFSRKKNFQAWMARVGERPAVKKGMAILS